MIELKARVPAKLGRPHTLELTFYLPAALQVSPRTYPRERFLGSVITRTRYQVRREGLGLLDSDDDEENPLVRIERSVQSDAEYDYEVRMFCNLLHSAAKDELRQIRAGRADPAAFVAHVRAILLRWERVAWTDNPATRDAWEYVLGTTARRVARVILSTGDPHPVLTPLLDELSTRAAAHGWDPLQAAPAIVRRDSELKKWVQSLLYLELTDSQRGEQLFQIAAGAAAGIAMTVAVAATIFAESRWAGGSLPWAIALVGAYIVKDRLKEGVRTMLVRRLPGVVQDQVTLIREQGTPVARKVTVIRYPSAPTAWSAITYLNRFVFRSQRRTAHRRVDALVEIIRIDAADWLSRLDRAWKIWPVRTPDGHLALADVQREYTFYALVRGPVERVHHARRRSSIPGDGGEWYLIRATREELREVRPLDHAPSLEVGE